MATDPSNAATLSSVEHIAVTPGTCGGKPRVADTRIRVQDIVVWHERMGLSVYEIIARYSQLSLASVYAALAYYHDHREQIDAQMQADERLVDEMRKSYPSKVAAKLDNA